MSDAIDNLMYDSYINMTQRAAEDDLISRVFMMTADSVWFELHIADIHKDTIIISSVNMG